MLGGQPNDQAITREGEAAAGDWSIVQRDDGGKQWVYEGKPLYRWAKDQKPGDMTGDGFNGVWHIVKAEHAVQGQRNDMTRWGY